MPTAADVGPASEQHFNQRTLASPLDWALYAVAWAVFAAGFAAVYWLQQRAGSPTPLRAATSGAARVVLPAALLGIGVIRFCERVRWGWPPRAAATLTQIAAAFVFPALWISAVNVTSNVLSGAAFGAPSWRFPPEHVVHWHVFTGVLIYVSLCGLTYGRACARAAEWRRAQAEARALRAQLNPHFLFNAMHTVFALARMDPDAAEDAMTRLSRLMRYTLRLDRDDRERVALHEEWAFTEDYLSLEALRLEHRLRWAASIDDDARECGIPPMLLQPLVENALKHGLPGPDSVCAIHVEARCVRRELVIRVSDTGPGSTLHIALGSRGIGLRSLRYRIATITGRGDAVRVESCPGGGFAVTVRMPALRWSSAPAASPDPMPAVVGAV